MDSCCCGQKSILNNTMKHKFKYIVKHFSTHKHSQVSTYKLEGGRERERERERDRREGGVSGVGGGGGGREMEIERQRHTVRP